MMTFRLNMINVSSPIFLLCFIMQCFSHSENNQIGYGNMLSMVRITSLHTGFHKMFYLLVVYGLSGKDLKITGGKVEGVG